MIGEMFVKYFGRHTLKHHFRRKPTCLGYKIWAMCRRRGSDLKASIDILLLSGYHQLDCS